MSECLLHWQRRRLRYRAERQATERTFLKRVTENKLRDLYRHQHTATHGKGVRNVPFDEPIGENGKTLAELLLDSAVENDPVQAIWDEERRAAITRARARLRASERDLFDVLAAEKSMSDAERELGVPRATLYRVKAEIGRVFEDEGLRDFM